MLFTVILFRICFRLALFSQKGMCTLNVLFIKLQSPNAQEHFAVVLDMYPKCLKNNTEDIFFVVSFRVNTHIFLSSPAKVLLMIEYFLLGFILIKGSLKDKNVRQKIDVIWGKDVLSPYGRRKLFWSRGIFKCTTRKRQIWHD